MTHRRHCVQQVGREEGMNAFEHSIRLRGERSAALDAAVREPDDDFLLDDNREEENRQRDDDGGGCQRSE